MKGSEFYNDLSVLSIDIGTKTGWAFKDKHGLINSGVVDFKCSRYEGGGMRYLRFKKWLLDFIKISNGLDAIFIEEVRRHKGTDAAHIYGGFLACITSIAEENNIP